jgi:ABC-type transporter MlaC component
MPLSLRFLSFRFLSFRPAAFAWSAGAVFALASVSVQAGSDDPQEFVREQHDRIEQLLHESVSSARDSRIREALGNFVDYDELTHRAFGEPCPRSEPGCEDLWVGYSEDQRVELRNLLEELVRKTVKRNLQKTLDFDVDYRGSRETGGDFRVMTQAKNRQKPREPPVRVDYIVMQTGSGPRVADIITEGSSLTKNYYDQFRRKMHNANEGYPNIVQKLREKIAKND